MTRLSATHKKFNIPAGVKISSRVLPNLLSDLILVACDDMEKAIKLNSGHEVVIDFGSWYDANNMFDYENDEHLTKPVDATRCEICFGGAVMIGTLKVNPFPTKRQFNKNKNFYEDPEVYLSDASSQLSKKLDALDEIRGFGICHALHNFARWKEGNFLRDKIGNQTFEHPAKEIEERIQRKFIKRYKHSWTPWGGELHPRNYTRFLREMRFVAKQLAYYGY